SAAALTFFLSGFLSFEEVAVDFTLEEWALLDWSQRRALCVEVTLEAFRNIIALGKSPLCSRFHSLGKEGFFGELKLSNVINSYITSSSHYH
uniref:KRAB domain-containing protein n=1 Tax=Naja naja TaxID=35670 RepID=A0A8C6VBU5_NAJNA